MAYGDDDVDVGAPAIPIAFPSDDSPDPDLPLRIALGSKKDLNDFAMKVAALPYKNWGNYQPSSTTQAAYAKSIMDIATAFPEATFHFNLTDGITGNRIEQTYSQYPKAITSTEFLVLSTVLKDRSFFYVKSGTIYKPVILP